jgi:hypothetical protein
MPFPSFGDLAKSVNDLFDFQDANEVSFTRKTASGMVVETTATSASPLAGKVKATLKDKSIGKLVLNADTGGAFKTKATFTELAQNVSVTLEHAFKGSHKGSASATFSQEQFALTGKVTVAQGETTSADFDVSVVGGADGITGGVNVLASSSTQTVTDYNVGVSYAQDKLFGALTTDTKCLGQNFHFQYAANDNATVFVQASRLPTESGSEFCGGAGYEYDLGSDTTVKQAFNCSKILKSSITHTLANPSVSITLAAVHEATSRHFNTQSVSFGVEIGEQ